MVKMEQYHSNDAENITKLFFYINSNFQNFYTINFTSLFLLYIISIYHISLSLLLKFIM